MRFELLLPFLLIYSFLGFAQTFETVSEKDVNFVSLPVKYSWVADPFEKKPGFVPNSNTAKTFQLNAIVFDEEDSIAYINSQEVEVNTIIEGYRVAKIGTHFVLLKKGDSVLELQLPPIKNNATTEVLELDDEY